MLSAARLPDVRLAVITTEPPDRLSPELREALAGHWQVADALDPQQIADAVRGLSGQVGRVERLIGALEQLQVPLAQARDALGIEGMSADVATNVRDKSQMKSVLAAAGVPCARHQLVRRTEEALAFRDLVGYPMVAKPPDGAGAKATFRLDSAGDFDSWLAAAQHDPGEVWLLEEFLTGKEHTFDSVTLGGETIWASISDYRPPPLEVLRTPWVQWTVLLPAGRLRACVRRDPLPRPGRAAGPGGAGRVLPHGVVRASRRLGGDLGGRGPAARCPAGLHDRLQPRHRLLRDLGELVIKGTFDPPSERRYASGTAYLRGMGRGQVRTVHGIDQLQAEIGHLVVDSRLPQPGTRPTARTRARASSPCGTRRPPWSRTRWPGSSPRPGSS